MLIIAMPKTASTSLMKTLGQVHNLSTCQGFYPDLPLIARYPEMSHEHSDIRRLPRWIPDCEIADYGVWKQHWPLNVIINIKTLIYGRTVILYRNPDNIIAAIDRAVERGYSRPLRNEQQYKRELQKWHDSWLNVDGSNLMLWVNFEELVDNPARTIAAIEKFWRLPFSDTMTLVKRRYTRE